MSCTYGELYLTVLGAAVIMIHTVFKERGKHLTLPGFIETSSETGREKRQSQKELQTFVLSRRFFFPFVRSVRFYYSFSINRF